MVEHLKGRPCSIIRAPDGNAGAAVGFQHSLGHLIEWSRLDCIPKHGLGKRKSWQTQYPQGFGLSLVSSFVCRLRDADAPGRSAKAPPCTPRAAPAIYPTSEGEPAPRG